MSISRLEKVGCDGGRRGRRTEGGREGGRKEGNLETLLNISLSLTNIQGSKPGHVVDYIEMQKVINQCEAWHWRSQAQILLQLKQRLANDTPENTELKK